VKETPIEENRTSEEESIIVIPAGTFDDIKEGTNTAPETTEATDRDPYFNDVARNIVENHQD
jgi:hypothetical protein